MGTLEDKILLDIGMTQKHLENGVEHLIQWIRKQPHLPDVQDKDLLTAFIVGSKSIEKAKFRLDKYFTARTQFPDFFSNRDPNTIDWKKITLKGVYLPGSTEDGYTVALYKFPVKQKDIEEFCLLETCRRGFMVLDIFLKSIPVNAGQIMIMDFKDVTKEVILKLITTNTSSISNIYHYTYPIRFKAIVCINVSPTITSFLNGFIKLFYNEKLQQRVHFTSRDHRELEKFFPLAMLPRDYGGNNPSIDEFDTTTTDLMKNRDWLMTEGSLRSDETKRQKIIGQPQELQGTFIKLDID